MFQIFTKVYIPAFGHRMLIDLFAQYSNKRADLTKFRNGFDSEQEYLEWVFNYGTFRTYEAAKKWIDVFKAKGEEYFIMEVFGEPIDHEIMAHKKKATNQ